MDIKITKLEFSEILYLMKKNIENKLKCQHIGITNTETMYHAKKNKLIRNYVMNAQFSLCDGIGLSITSLIWDTWVPRRNGPIFMLKAFDYGQEHNWKHFLYGGKDDDQTHKLSTEILKKYPNANIVGKYSPPFRPLNDVEEDELINLIDKIRPDIIWVGLGLPKQENFINDLKEKLKARDIFIPYLVGVGAAFDYHSGEVIWAPDWIQKIGMEWLFRTFIQPKVRIKRYIWSFQIFFEAILRGIFKRFFNA